MEPSKALETVITPKAVDFPTVWAEAQAAGQAAAIAENARLGAEGSRGFDCGFAWIKLRGDCAFGRWLKKQGLASPGYPGGLQVWYSKVHSLPTQSVSVHETACRAAHAVIMRHLPDLKNCYTSSRLD